jgi:hypothetical protein
MSAFNSLTDGYVTSPDPGPPPSDSNAGATRGATMGPNVSGVHISALQGTPPLTGAHNTPLHVAFLGIVALLVVILLRKAGFRFSVAGSIGGR